MRKLPVDVQIRDYRLAEKARRSLTLGHYFAFVDLAAAKRTGRLKRLLAEPGSEAPLAICPLVDQLIEIPGIRLDPKARELPPIASLTTDRDLYRAGDDTVSLFIAVPSSPGEVDLEVTLAGESLLERRVSLENGIALETVSALLPGRYRAQMTKSGRRIGEPVEFTVAEFTRAPLSARLVEHELDRAGGTLDFALDVTSYEVPFEDELDVSLVGPDGEVSRSQCRMTHSGRFEGRVTLLGEGPFRLRVVSASDPSKLAEVALLGSGAAERDHTIVSELGRERFFSMMPEPSAIPVRGGYLGEGDYLTTPVVAREITGERCTLEVVRDVEALAFVVVDLVTGELSASERGAASAGESVVVDTPSSLCTVVVGAVVDGRPFEGFTSFLRKSALDLSLDVPETVRPGETIEVTVRVEGAKGAVPLLLSIRDQRLTASDKPATSLGASMKRAIGSATEGMSEGFFDGVVSHHFDYFAREDLPEVSLRASAPLAARSLTRAGRWLRATLEPAPSAAAAPDERPEAPPVRSEFPTVFFHGIVPVDGREVVAVPAGDSLGTLVVEAFCLHDGDWKDVQAQVRVDKPLRVDLDFPAAVFPGDRVFGRLRVASPSGRARVALTKDGLPYAIPQVTSGESLDTPKEIELPVEPGVYVATVTDVESGESDAFELTVEVPGSFKSLVKELGLLLPGDHVTLDSADASTLRVLPALEESFETLVSATASYEHLCCEQTAAKILAATYLYLIRDDEPCRKEAESILLAGVEREKSMLVPRHGFAMYPGASVNEHYSRLAVRYLWTLAELERLDGLSPALVRAAREGVELADEAAKAHKMTRAPKKAATPAEAYASASAGRRGPAERFFEKLLDWSGESVGLRRDVGRVERRAALAYAGAFYLDAGRLESGIRLANQVMRELNEQGRLYSTVDSAAAIVLMIALRRARVVSAEARVRVNGQEASLAEAASLGDAVESIEVLEGVVAVEMTRLHEDRWDDAESAFRLRVGFRDESGRAATRFRAGERTELVIALPEGYRDGDLAHVCLPASLSRIEGGGRLARFSLDFAGEDELRVPLVVTSRIETEQHFAVCVRNMFEEERMASPGLLTVGPA